MRQASVRPPGSAAGPSTSAQDVAPAVAPAEQRVTPFGVFQDLRFLMATRKAIFVSVFEMAANRSRHRGQPLPPGLVSRGGVMHVVQRCIPEASDHDVQYVMLLMEAVLPKSNAISIKDMAYAVKQGATVEKLVSSHRLPTSIRGILATMADEFIGPKRQRIRRAFQDLDWNHIGRLLSHEQALLLQALSPSMRRSELLWLTCCLHWYAEADTAAHRRKAGSAAGSAGGSAGVEAGVGSEGGAAAADAGAVKGAGAGLAGGQPMGLSYEELAEVLRWLSQQQPQRHGLEEGEELDAAWQQQQGGEAWGDVDRQAYPDQQGPWDNWSPWHGGAPHQHHPYPAGMGPYPGAGAGPYSAAGAGPYPAAGLGLHPAGLGPYPAVGDWGQWPHNGFSYVHPSGGVFRVTEGPWMQQGVAPGVEQEAGEAYCTWVLKSRQKVMEQWFVEDHARKLRVLEEEKTKLQLQQQLRKDILGLKHEVRSIETGMSNLGRQLERNAWEMTGRPPVQVLDLKGLTERVGRAMDQAVRITRVRALEEGLEGGGAVVPTTQGAAAAVSGDADMMTHPTIADLEWMSAAGAAGAVGAGTAGAGTAAAAGAVGAGSGGAAGAAGAGAVPGAGAPEVLHSEMSLEELLERLASPDWLARARLPRNSATLRLALEMRTQLEDLSRLHRSNELRLELEKQQGEMAAEEARHGMALQAQAMQAQLQMQAAELQHRLLMEAQVYALSAQQQQQQQQVLLYQQAQQLAGGRMLPQQALVQAQAQGMLPVPAAAAGVASPAATYSYSHLPGAAMVSPARGLSAFGAGYAPGMFNSSPAVPPGMSAGLGAMAGAGAWPGYVAAAPPQQLLVPRGTSD